MSSHHTTSARRRVRTLAAATAAAAVIAPLGMTAASGAASGAASTFPDSEGFIFGFSSGSCGVLGLRVTTGDGEQLLPAVDSGWYNELGRHGATNENYFVGTDDTQELRFRNFFVFDLTAITGTATAATLEVPQAGCSSIGESPVSTYRLYDVGTAVVDLSADQSDALDTFEDLGGGVPYGRQAVTDPNQDVAVPFTAEGLEALDAARGGAFAVGGAYADEAAKPTISAVVRSAEPRTASGWYRTPATIEYSCTSGHGLDADGCPAAVELTRSKTWFVTRAATDTAGNRVAKRLRVKIDMVAPRLFVKRVRDGKTYDRAPRVRCRAIDRLSRLAEPCRATTEVVRSSRTRQVMRFEAVATDRAGNSRTRTGTYAVRR